MVFFFLSPMSTAQIVTLCGGLYFSIYKMLFCCTYQNKYAQKLQNRFIDAERQDLTGFLQQQVSGSKDNMRVVMTDKGQTQKQQ